MTLAERLVPEELWHLFRRVVPPTEVIRPQGGGRRRAGDRVCLTAIIFVATSGCTWRQLPPTFGPAGPTVYRRFARWSRDRVRARLHRVVLDELGAGCGRRAMTQADRSGAVQAGSVTSTSRLSRRPLSAGYSRSRESADHVHPEGGPDKLTAALAGRGGISLRGVTLPVGRSRRGHADRRLRPFPALAPSCSAGRPPTRRCSKTWNTAITSPP
ncbi:transposase [Streptomyces sp. 2333.5]|nr:transposase [Streptomyces sp. 2333.5]